MIEPPISRDERERLRQALLRFCEQDTLALVRILERMRSFANSPEHVMIAQSVPGDELLLKPKVDAEACPAPMSKSPTWRRSRILQRAQIIRFPLTSQPMRKAL